MIRDRAGLLEREREIDGLVERQVFDDVLAVVIKDLDSPDVIRALQDAWLVGYNIVSGILAPFLGRSPDVPP